MNRVISQFKLNSSANHTTRAAAATKPAKPAAPKAKPAAKTATKPQRAAVGAASHTKDHADGDHQTATKSRGGSSPEHVIPLDDDDISDF